MSAVVLEVMLRFPHLSGQPVRALEATADRLADDIELSVMGIGELVGYDLDVEASVLKLLVNGEDGSRLVAAVLPVARATHPAEGSYYTIAPLERDGGHPPTERLPL